MPGAAMLFRRRSPRHGEGPRQSCLINLMSLDPEQRRRLDSKRFNERVKLAYTTVNAFAIGIVGAALIVPGVSSAGACRSPTMDLVIGRGSATSPCILHRSAAPQRRVRPLSDAELWQLTLEIVILACVVGGGSYFWLRRESRRLDRKYGERQSPGELAPSLGYRYGGTWLGKIRQRGQDRVAGGQPEEQDCTPHQAGKHVDPHRPTTQRAGDTRAPSGANRAGHCLPAVREAPAPTRLLGVLGPGNNNTREVSKSFPPMWRKGNRVAGSTHT